MPEASDISAVLQELNSVAGSNTETLRLLTEIRKVLMKVKADSLFQPHEPAPLRAGFLYMISRFVNDLWFNLCVDASFDFPEQSPEVKSIGAHLRDFLICISLPQPAVDEAVRAFGGAVESYYKFVSQKNRALERVAHLELHEDHL